MTPAEVVRALFERMQARDWEGVGATLAPDVEVWWPATDERFSGSAFLAVQRAYPEGWAIAVEEVVADGDRVAARVRVDQDGQRFWCAGFYRVAGDRIRAAVEHWVTEAAETPPAWRRSYTDAPR